MRKVEAMRNFILLHDDGTVHFPFSKFLTERFSNPNTRDLVAQSLRIFYRFCNSCQIELAVRATKGKCLTYDEGRQLGSLCFRPIEELEALSNKKIFSFFGAKTGKRPENLKNAVQANYIGNKKCSIQNNQRLITSNHANGKPRNRP